MSKEFNAKLGHLVSAYCPMQKKFVRITGHHFDSRHEVIIHAEMNFSDDPKRPDIRPMLFRRHELTRYVTDNGL